MTKDVLIKQRDITDCGAACLGLSGWPLSIEAARIQDSADSWNG